MPSSFFPVIGVENVRDVCLFGIFGAYKHENENFKSGKLHVFKNFGSRKLHVLEQYETIFAALKNKRLTWKNRSVIM